MKSYRLHGVNYYVIDTILYTILEWNARGGGGIKDGDCKILLKL